VSAAKDKNIYIRDLVAIKYDLVSDLYRQRARAFEVVAKSQQFGNPLVYACYELFGSDLIGTLAFRLDPYWQFVRPPIRGRGFVKRSNLLASLFPLTVIPANRKRLIPAIVPYSVIIRGNSTVYSRANALKFVNFEWSVGPVQESSSVTPKLTHPADQQECYGFVKDTTWKSRNPSAKKIPFTKRKRELIAPNSQGEFELFLPELKNMGVPFGFAKQNTTIYTTNAVVMPNGQHPVTFSNQRIQVTGDYVSGRCATVSKALVDANAIGLQTKALSVISKSLDGMLSHCLPTRRLFNLTYQIAELKDLPETLRGTLNLWRDVEKQLNKIEFLRALSSVKFWHNPDVVQRLKPFAKRVGVNIDVGQRASDNYLNFKFGWESMVQALDTLVKKPTAIAKEVNNLLARNGKSTTLSFQFHNPGISMPSPPAITLYPPVTLDHGLPESVSHGSETIRCVVNSTIAFPATDIPALRTKLWLAKIGLDPTPGDLYDLIPWSWLFDWFAGLGEYIHLLDAINGDDFLINWGFMSYKYVGDVTAQMQISGTGVASTQFVPGSTTSFSTKSSWTIGARYSVKYEYRLSLDKLANVKTYSGKGLSLYQASILAALSSKFG
jgi:hypothetical protein